MAFRWVQRTGHWVFYIDNEFMGNLWSPGFPTHTVRGKEGKWRFFFPVPGNKDRAVIVCVESWRSFDDARSSIEAAYS